MKYPISILYMTCRIGGIDFLKYLMDEQTFRDFEVVIVDEWFETRKKEVPEYLSDYHVKHLPPKVKKPYVAIPNACNTGLMHVEGELVVFLNDFILPPKNWLESFWNTHVEFERKNLMHGPLSKRANLLQIISPVGMGPEIYAQKCKITVFKVPPSRESIEVLPVTATYDKSGCIRGSIRARTGTSYAIYKSDMDWFWAGTNDACPLEALLAINGADERYDGAWQGWDPDVGVRASGAGYGTLYIADMWTIEVEHHNIMKFTEKIDRDMQDNHRMFHEILSKVRSGDLSGVWAGNPYNLADERVKLGYENPDFKASVH